MLELESKEIMKACSKCFKKHGFICAGKLTKECSLGITKHSETPNKCYHLRTYETVNSDNETQITKLICANCGKVINEKIEYGNFRGFEI